MSSNSPIILSELPLPVHPHPRAQRNTHHHEHTPRATRHHHTSRAPSHPTATQTLLSSPTPRYPPSVLLEPAAATRFAARAGAPDLARSASRVSVHYDVQSVSHEAVPHFARYDIATTTEDEATFLYETFAVTGSRVLRVLNAQPTLAAALARLRAAMAVSGSLDNSEVPSKPQPQPPMRVWARPGRVWVVFATHEESRLKNHLFHSDPANDPPRLLKARLALALALQLQTSHQHPYSTSTLELEPALHTDLEPHDTLQSCLLEDSDSDLTPSTDLDLRTIQTVRASSLPSQSLLSSSLPCANVRARRTSDVRKHDVVLGMAPALVVSPLSVHVSLCVRCCPMSSPPYRPIIPLSRSRGSTFSLHPRLLPTTLPISLWRGVLCIKCLELDADAPSFSRFLQTAPAYTHTHIQTYNTTATTTMHRTLALDLDDFDFAALALGAGDDAPASPESAGGPRTPQDAYAGYGGEYVFNGKSTIGNGGEKTRDASSAATAGFTLSSNPPNPKTSFRAGDWL
ncbi:hypothetical protein EIP86_006349 [Pleurotus ostreatoroseus]|nr:hypothetical protein EIP86_006349 [Pleurotus ostreatoroseus]